MNIEQQIIEKVRILPDAKKAKVLEYVEEIGEQKELKLPKYLQRIEEMRAKLPKDAFDGYPTDGSLNHDHYLYGSPKRESK
jgi:hypothetical protein